MITNANGTIYNPQDVYNVLRTKSKNDLRYNTYFDIKFLENSGVIFRTETDVVDVMRDFAVIYGKWSDYFEEYKWQKLTTAARYYGYDWKSIPEGAHNSLADCYATLFVYRKIKGVEKSET